MRKRRDTAHAQLGTFELVDGTKLPGRLKLDGPKTKLWLFSGSPFNPRSENGNVIRGTLNNLTRVSLVDCVCPGAGYSSNREEKSYFARVFPHFVVSGSQFFDPSEASIFELSFVIDDATKLFYDFDAFGSLIHPERCIDQIVNAARIELREAREKFFSGEKENEPEREIPTGDCPQIQYFTGKRMIFEADTILGKISAIHSPIWGMGGPEGVRIKNTIRVHVRSSAPINFSEAMDRISILRDYLGLLVGRPQNMKQISLNVSETEIPIPLNVHWSLCPVRKEGSGTIEGVSPADVLIDAIREPRNFSDVLSKWLDRQKSWKDSRQRFFGLFSKQKTYDIDRLIGAANMFDILPPVAVPSRTLLEPKLKAAKAEAQKSFKLLAPSPERDSILGALGRIGKPSLKRKVRSRAELVLSAFPDLFPDLIRAVDAAVDTRNYFVHGGDPPIDSQDSSGSIWFLVDTLEFVFAASDLIEAGWDVGKWVSRAGSSHQFGEYRRNFVLRFAELKRRIR